MRTFYEPATLALSVLSLVGTGFSAYGNYKAASQQRVDLKQQAQLANVQTERDLVDLDLEKGRTKSRMKAILAAQGGGINYGLLDSVDVDYDVSEQRLREDNYFRQRGLRIQSDNIGRNSIFSTASTAVSGLGRAGSILRQD